MAMEINVRVVGADDAILSFGKLGKNMSVTQKDLAEVSAESIQRGAKLRAPRWKGRLAEKIEAKTFIDEKKKTAINVGVLDQWIGGPHGYASAQEYGFRAHMIRGYYPTMTGFIFKQWAEEKGITDRTGAPFTEQSWMMVYKPPNPSGYFFGPAVRAATQRLDKLMDRAVEHAIRKAGFK